MKRPFVTLCIFLLIGITISYLFNYFIPIYYVTFVALLTLISLLIYEKMFNTLLLITVIFLGIYIYGQSILGSTLLENSTPSSIIKVEILNEPSIQKGYSRYEVVIINMFLDEESKAVKINKKAQLNMYNSSTDVFTENFSFIAGDIVQIKNVNIRKLLENYEKDSVNGYELYLKSKGLQYILNVNINDIKKDNIDFKYLNMLNMSYKAKAYLENFLDSTLQFENSNILKSIIFGNQGYLSKDRLELFSKTGTAHIMAVSGLHVGLMVLITDRFLKLIKIGRNNRIYLTTIILIFYGYAVHFPVSIIRAGAMYFLYVIAYFLQRRYDSINALFFIAFILLIYNPITIFSISFQLSFIATLSILVLTPILTKKLNKIAGMLSPLLSVTLAAQIGTLPIMVYHFKQISLISVATNILIVPLIAPMLAISFASVLIGTISFKLGFITNQIANNILNYIKWITTKFVALPYASFEVDEIKFIHIFIYYTILIAIYFFYSNREKDDLKDERLVRTYEL